MPVARELSHLGATSAPVKMREGFQTMQTPILPWPRWSLFGVLFVAADVKQWRTCRVRKSTHYVGRVMLLLLQVLKL